MNSKLQELKLIHYFFKPYKTRLFILLCVMLVSGLMEILNIAALYPVLSYGLNLKNDNFMLRACARFADSIGYANKFFAACVILMIITIVALLFKYAYSEISNRLMARISADTQKSIFNKLTSLDYAFFEKNQQGRLVYISTVAPGQVADVVLYAIKLVYDLIFSFLLFWLLFILAWQGTLFLLIVGAVYGFFIKKVMKGIISKCAHLATEEDRKKNVILNEVITGIKSIKVFRNFPYWLDKYDKVVEKSVSNKYKMLMGRLLPESFMKFIFFAILAASGMILSAMPQDVLISALPLFSTFVMVAARFFPSVQLVGNDLIIIADCMPNVKTVYNFCSQEIAHVSSGSVCFNKFNDKVCFKNIFFKYGALSDYVLKGFSVEFNKREVTAFVGLSGSGKTTIVNLLLRLYAPAQGSIKIDGIDIFEYTDNSYLSKISYVSQETFIFNDTIRENIRFGMPGCDNEMIIEAAKKAFAHDFIMKTEYGYDSLAGDSGMKLSGGQRQRIAIARAILRKPEIIILDEATSSLDNILEKDIQKSIELISVDTTVLVIAHRLSTVQNADKIIVLKDGMLFEEGRHKELLENKKLYFELCMKQEFIR